MPRTNSNGVAIVVIILGITTLGALGYYVTQPKANVPNLEKREPVENSSNKPQVEITVKPQQEKTEVTVLTPDFVENELVFWGHQVQVPKGEDPKIFAVNQYLAKIPAVPSDAKLLSCQIENGVAVANFSQSIFAGYGTEDEQMVINGILATFGNFEEVKSVRFLVGGEVIETLGNIEIKDPQPVIRQ